MLSHQRQFRYCRDLIASELLNDHLHALNTAQADIHDTDNTEPDPPHAWDDPDGENDPAVDLDAMLEDFVVALPRLQLPSSNPPGDPPPPVPATSRTEPEVPVDIDVFPGAGNVIREDTPIMHRWAKRHGHVDNPYHPFKSKVDWEIGRWAKQEGPGASALDRLLKFDSVRS